MKRLRYVAALVAAVMAAAQPADARQGGPGAAPFAAMQKAWSAGDLDEAIAQAEKVLAVESRNVSYLTAIGGLYCEKARKANVFTQGSWAGKCRSTWEKALVVDPKNLDVRFMLVQYHLEAPAIVGGGVGNANKEAGEIAKIDPVAGEIARGNIARSRKQMTEAEQHYRRSAELDGSGMRGPVALAGFFAGQRRWAEARAIFDQLLAKNAADQFAVFQLARLRQAEGTDLESALALFDRFLTGPAVPNGPGPVDAWFRKGQVLDKMGRKADAIASFEAALKLAPGHPGVLGELKRLKGQGQ